MNNEEKVKAAKKDAGGDEKLIIKFAWPNIESLDLLRLEIIHMRIKSNHNTPCFAKTRRFHMGGD